MFKYMCTFLQTWYVTILDEYEDGSSGKEKEAPIEKGETTDDEPGQCFYIDDPAAKADCENAL